MNTAQSTALILDASSHHCLDELRRASWLKCNYSDHIWFVTDTDTDSKIIRIDFRYRLADGRCLTEVERLYATVKEFAWFVRDARFSKIDSARGHKAAVYGQLAIAHALTLRGIASYAHLQRGDIDALVQECRFGVDGLLQASERLAAYIESIESDTEARSQRYKGFPDIRTAKGYGTNILSTSRLVAACNLPRSAAYLPRVNWLVATAALRNGMKSTSKVRSPEIPPLQNNSKQQLQRFGDAIELLFAIRHHAQCEVPSIRPFPDGVWKMADRYGVDSTPTPVPPPKLVLHLLEESAKWIANCSPSILACIDEFEAVGLEGQDDLRAAIDRCRAGLPPAVGQQLLDRGGHERFLLSAVEMTVTASWVIIAAFSARRYEETVDLQKGSLLGNDEEGWWLDSFISKTTRQRELIPVPLIVARAVETLIAISASARLENVENIFRWRAPAAAKDRWSPRQISPNRLVNEFAKLVDTPLHEDGENSVSWHWFPRQFRRFFAVVYFYRFEGADIATLSYFLRHFDIETTRGYVTRDPEAAKIWREVEKTYVRRLAESIVSGEREVSGAMGERLKKLAILIKNRLEKRLFVSEETVGSTLQHIMERGGLVITPKAWVTCTCPRTHNAAKKARCRKGQEVTDDIIGPSYADAGPPVCNECPWALKEPTKDDYACRTKSNLEASVESSNGFGTLFRELEQAQLVSLGRVTVKRTGRAGEATSEANNA